MSRRWYPIYQLGNPQLRVFLPKFWMRLVKPEYYKYPPNVVLFHCSIEMTDHDVKNYLQKIYDIPVLEAHTMIMTGRFRKCHGRNYIIKEDDVKLAKVILPKSEKFVFPDLFPEEEKEDKTGEEAVKIAENKTKEFLKRNSQRPGVPAWFS